MLKDNVKNTLDKYAAGIVIDIKQRMEATGAIATGDTVNSLHYEATATGFVIYGGKAFEWIERGRGPTKPGSGQTGEESMREKLERWIKAKGIETDDKGAKRMSYALARKIHEEGTQLHKKGVRREIYTAVITRDRLEDLKKQLGGFVLKEVKSEFIQAFK